MADDFLVLLAAFHGQVFPSFMVLMPYLFLCPSKYSWSIRHVIARGFLYSLCYNYYYLALLRWCWEYTQIPPCLSCFFLQMQLANAVISNTKGRKKKRVNYHNCGKCQTRKKTVISYDLGKCSGCLQMHFYNFSD